MTKEECLKDQFFEIGEIVSYANVDNISKIKYCWYCQDIHSNKILLYGATNIAELGNN